ncbi:MAG: DsbE family thiol:disulfide interchange protein [Dokdonella sp.]
MSRLLPLLGFVVLVALFGFGIRWNMHHDQREVPSPLIGKPAPTFSLPVFGDDGRRYGSSELKGQPYVINVFASWCIACRDEHPLLMAQGKELGVPLIGLNYKDEPDDASRWLAQFGNPYSTVIADYDGRLAIDFGVYGAPETFLVDAAGVIRYKRIGPLTPDAIQDELLPAIAAARGAP